MILVVLGLLGSLQKPLTAKDVLSSFELVSQNVVRIGGPSAVEETVGTICIYRTRANWKTTSDRVRAQVASQRGFVEFRGFSGMRWFWNSTDRSFHWDIDRNLAAVGLLRDFKASHQKLLHPYAPTVHGSKEDGWITALAFDGSIIQRQRVGTQIGPGAN